MDYSTGLTGLLLAIMFVMWLAARIIRRKP